ncbi:MAG TPA: hypothetical protein VGN17_01010 [Bryobacteraceae bacterium]|jgi:hypothetical protein
MEKEPEFPVDPQPLIEGANSADAELSELTDKMEPVLDVVDMTPTEVRQTTDTTGSWLMEKARRLLQAEVELQELSKQLSDAARWRDLRRRDVRKYRAELTSFLRRCKAAVDIIAGIPPHRLPDEERSWQIVQIVECYPDFSFGQVAREFTKLTKKPLTAKQAERIYKRASP